MKTQRFQPTIKTDRKLLDALLENAKNRVMSSFEIETQRRSWVIGELMLSNPDMTRAQAEAIYDNAT